MVWMRPFVRSGTVGRHVTCSSEEATKTKHPCVPKGFGTPPAIVVEAQGPLTVLIKRFCRPPLPIQADSLGGAPIHPIRHQHHRATRQRLVLATHHEAHLAQPWAAGEEHR